MDQQLKVTACKPDLLQLDRFRAPFQHDLADVSVDESAKPGTAREWPTDSFKSRKSAFYINGGRGHGTLNLTKAISAVQGSAACRLPRHGSQSHI